MEELDQTCVFYGNLVILVNGCLTREIIIERDQKQGDPLASFLFLLVVEGLSGLIFKAIKMALFIGIKVRSLDLVISHLQYVDETILLADATIDNL